MAGEATQAGARRLVASGDLDLAVPECVRGIGSVILSPSSEHLIAGVKVEPFAVYPDDRGYFLEVHRMGRGLAAAFPVESTQMSAALNYSGTVKAFHYHLHQHDCWAPVFGLLQVALVDLRLGSPTFGARNRSTSGRCGPGGLIPGVGHGYKVVGNKEAMLSI